MWGWLRAHPFQGLCAGGFVLLIPAAVLESTSLMTGAVVFILSPIVSWMIGRQMGLW